MSGQNLLLAFVVLNSNGPEKSFKIVTLLFIREFQRKTDLFIRIKGKNSNFVGKDFLLESTLRRLPSSGV